MSVPSSRDQALPEHNGYGRPISRTARRGRAALIGVDRPAAEMYRLAFVLNGLSVDVARDGEEGLHRLLCQELPDVVVVDLGLPRVNRNVPRRDALELLSVLSSIRATQNLPVLALADDVEMAVEALERGAAAWLPKQESSPSTVLSVVNRLLTERKPAYRHAESCRARHRF